MKKRIASLEEFNEERRRTRLRNKELETLIEQDVHQLKESLQPIKVAGSMLKNFMSLEKNSAMSDTTGFIIDSIINRIFSANPNTLLRSL